jgi:hypothetical protein
MVVNEYIFNHRSILVLLRRVIMGMHLVIDVSTFVSVFYNQHLF